MSDYITVKKIMEFFKWLKPCKHSESPDQILIISPLTK